MVDAAECAVVDDALEPGGIGGDPGDGVEGGGGFAAGGGDPVGVEDDAAVAVGGAHGDEHELEAPGGLAGAFEVQPGVGFEPWGADLAGLLVEDPSIGLGPKQRRDDLAVGVEHPRQVRPGPRSGAVGVKEPEGMGLVDGAATVDVVEFGEHGGVGEPGGAPVEVMPAAHRIRREPPVGIVGELVADQGAELVPHDRMRKFGFDAAG